MAEQLASCSGTGLLVGVFVMFLTYVHDEVLSWNICLHSAALGRLADPGVTAKVRYTPGACYCMSVWRYLLYCTT